MPFLSRTCFATVAVGSLTAAIAACGHLPFEAIPDPDAGPGQRDGGTSQPVDAGPDAGCTGPSCPGIYVSGETGSDENSGRTGEKPVKTITKGIELAAALGGAQNVYVAAALYAEKIILVDGVSLLGGYECNVESCRWIRDLEVNVTHVLATDFLGMVAPPTVTRRTLVDGLRIEGKEGGPPALPGSVAFTIAGGGPTVSRSSILGAQIPAGTATLRRSIAVAVLPAGDGLRGPLLVKNIIKSGDAADESVGVLIGGEGVAVAELLDNVIKSGTAPLTAGVFASTSAPGTTLKYNAITAGPSGIGAFGSWGVIVSSAMTLEGNQINAHESEVGACANTQTFCGGIASLSSAAIIRSNVVRGPAGPRTCAILLAEDETPAREVIVNGNTLDGGGGAEGDASMSAAIVLVNRTGTAVTLGKIRNNILLGGDNYQRYGVYEEMTEGHTAHPSALDNNDFWNPPPARADYAYHLWTGTALKVAFADLQTKLTTPIPIANISVDPQLTTDFHVPVTSPVIDQGTPTEAPLKDMDGQGRPKGAAIDIGADEAL